MTPQDLRDEYGRATGRLATAATALVSTHDYLMWIESRVIAAEAEKERLQSGWNAELNARKELLKQAEVWVAKLKAAEGLATEFRMLLERAYESNCLPAALNRAEDTLSTWEAAQKPEEKVTERTEP